jgi:hypothetical protein
MRALRVVMTDDRRFGLAILSRFGGRRLRRRFKDGFGNRFIEDFVKFLVAFVRKLPMDFEGRFRVNFVRKFLVVLVRGVVNG